MAQIMIHPLPFGHPLKIIVMDIKKFIVMHACSSSLRRKCSKVSKQLWWDRQRAADASFAAALIFLRKFVRRDGLLLLLTSSCVHLVIQSLKLDAYFFYRELLITK